MIELIIWDYNGTVIDDVDTTVAAVNDMLLARNLPPTDKETYIRTLVMPLDKYYETVGICNMDVSVLSVEFRKNFLKNQHLSKIFDDFFLVIDTVKKHGIKNILMSSLYEKYLSEETKKYKISGYFDDIIGMKDTSVGTKTQNAAKYIKSNSINPENVLFVGDLVTDAQMAQELGSKCILVARGHTDKQRLKKNGFPVCDNLLELIKYI